MWEMIFIVGKGETEKTDRNGRSGAVRVDYGGDYWGGVSGGVR